MHIFFGEMMKPRRKFKTLSKSGSSGWNLYGYVTIAVLSLGSEIRFRIQILLIIGTKLGFKTRFFVGRRS